MKNTIRIAIGMYIISMSCCVFAVEDSNITNRLKQQYKYVYFNKQPTEHYIVYDSEMNCGVVDINGNVVIPAIYDHISQVQYENGNQISSNTTADYIYTAEDKDGNYCAILPDNTIIIPLSRGYRYIHPFYINHDNLNYYYFVVDKINNDIFGQGICNAQGHETLKPEDNKNIVYLYPSESLFLNIFDDNNKKAGLYDLKQEKVILPCKYENVNSYNEIYWFTTEDKKQGQKIVQVYSRKKRLCNAKHVFTPVKGYDEEIVVYHKDKLWGYIDSKKGIVLTPAQYSSFEFFKDGVALAIKDSTAILLQKEKLYSGSKEFQSISVSRNVTNDIDTNIPNGNSNRENTFAIIFANENYENFVALGAKNDGNIFKEYCLKTLNIPNTNIIYYENATINNMHAAIQRIRNLAEVYEDGVNVIFYYSGQGITDNTRNEKYLLPTDGTISAVSNTCYNLNKLYSDISDTQNILQTVFLIDAPFNGYTRENKLITESRSVAIKSKKSEISNKGFFIEASSEGETAYYSKEHNHGLFTYYLLKTLQSTKGEITIQKLSEQTAQQVKDYSTKWLPTVQTPETTDNPDFNDTKL